MDETRYFETGSVNPPSAHSGWGSRARVRLDASCVLCICTAWPRAVFKHVFGERAARVTRRITSLTRSHWSLATGPNPWTKHGSDSSGERPLVQGHPKCLQKLQSILAYVYTYCLRGSSQRQPSVSIKKPILSPFQTNYPPGGCHILAVPSWLAVRMAELEGWRSRPTSAAL